MNMRGISILIFIGVFRIAYSQDESLWNETLKKDTYLQNLKFQVEKLERQTGILSGQLARLSVELSRTNKKIDSLTMLIEANQQQVFLLKDSLNMRVEDVSKKSQEQVEKLGKNIQLKSQYGLIITLFFLILLGTFFWLLNKGRKKDRTEVIGQLMETKKEVEEKLIAHLSKHAELLETQLKTLEQEKSSSTPGSQDEPDHSLALKVANEINLMERNLSQMDSNVRGYKQLKRSLEKLKDHLNAQGYEIVDLLGKPYYPGLPVVVVNSIPDENLEKGKEIISKILVPAVRYNDKIIQTAQIEVNVGV